MSRAVNKVPLPINDESDNKMDDIKLTGQEKVAWS